MVGNQCRPEELLFASWEQRYDGGLFVLFSLVLVHLVYL